MDLYTRPRRNTTGIFVTSGHMPMWLIDSFRLMIKNAPKSGFYDVTSARDVYREAIKTASIRMHHDPIRRYMKLQTLLLTHTRGPTLDRVHLALRYWAKWTRSSTLLFRPSTRLPDPGPCSCAGRISARTNIQHHLRRRRSIFEKKNLAKGKAVVSCGPQSSS